MVVRGKFNLGWIPEFFLMFSAGAAGPAVVILMNEKMPFFQRKMIRLIMGAR